MHKKSDKKHKKICLIKKNKYIWLSINQTNYKIYNDLQIFAPFFIEFNVV
jgi:hypothetical protein